MTHGGAARGQAAKHEAARTGPTRRICICVDDFGLNDCINDAALHLAGMQRVHAISALVGAPSWAAWAGVAQRLRASGVAIGLHLDLTEYPLLPGSRRSLRAWVVASHFRALDRAALRAEIRAQLDRFEDSLGAAPDFVDGHRHVHQLPVVRSELCTEIAHRCRPLNPWLRSTRRAPAPAGAGPTTWVEALKPWLIEQLGARGLESQARAGGLVQNKHLLGVYDFGGGARRYRALLDTWLGQAADGDLLMCHPARSGDTNDPLAAAREVEFEVLAGAEFGALLRQRGVTLQPMRSILQTTRQLP